MDAGAASFGAIVAAVILGFVQFIIGRKNFEANSRLADAALINAQTATAATRAFVEPSTQDGDFPEHAAGRGATPGHRDAALSYAAELAHEERLIPIRAK